MDDEPDIDKKILSVAATNIDLQYKHVSKYTGLSESFIEEITNFFEHYKGLEKDKCMKIKGQKDDNTAKKIITRAITAFSKDI